MTATCGPAPLPGAPEGASGAGWHRRVWVLAGPIMLSGLTTPLLGAVDTAVVGQLPDAAYIGAVAIGGIVFSFLFWGFGFLRMGTTGFTAQAFGAGDRDELRATLGRPLILALGLGALLIALQTPIGMLAFHLFDASPEVEALAASYYEIRIWSAPAALVNYAVLGWLLGTQRARTALVLQIALNGVNIVLDLVFAIGLGWGVEGVALASLIAEAGAAVLGIAVVGRVLARSGGHWDWARLKRRDRVVALFRVNRDLFLRTLALVIAFSYFTAQAAKMGDVTLAANAILLHLFSIMAYGLDGFSHAAEILAGGALGARSRAAFQGAVRAAAIWGLGCAVVVALIYAALGPWIIGLFTVLPEVQATAETYLPWMIASPLVSVWSFLLDGIFTGTTRTAAMRNAMAVSLLVYLGACWLLVPAFGNHGLWLAFTLLMAARAITLAVAYPRLLREI
jgi:MATE family multidrug resistance protein